MRHFILTLTVAISTFCFVIPIHAQTSLSLGGFSPDPEAPIEMTADRLTVNQLDGSAQFESNVVISQGDIHIAAELVTVTYLKDGGIDQLNATGGVTFVTQTESAEAETADYDLTNRQLVMSGGVSLIQGQRAISADKMSIDLETGAALMEGRVRTTLSRGSK